MARNRSAAGDTQRSRSPSHSASWTSSSSSLSWTPSHFSRIPPPDTPYDLERHACIGYRLTTSGGLLPWEFEKDGKEIKIRTSGPLIVNDGELPAAAVRAGVGLGYMMEHDVADEIASGALVQVLNDWCPPFPGFHLYHPSRRQSPPALRALIAALSVK